MQATPERKFSFTLVLFVLALLFVLLAGTTHVVWPLFVAWIPLLAVPYVLTRREEGTSPPVDQQGEELGASVGADTSGPEPDPEELKPSS